MAETFLGSECGFAADEFSVDDSFSDSFYLPVPWSELIGGREPEVGIRNFLNGPVGYAILGERNYTDLLYSLNHALRRVNICE